MKTKLIAFTLALLLAAGAATAAVRMYEVGKYIVYYETGETQALICTLAPVRES